MEGGADLNVRPETSNSPEMKRVLGGRMFELVQCGAGMCSRDVVVVSLRFPNIQTIHMQAEQDSI